MVGLFLFWNCFLSTTEKMYSVTTSLVACTRLSQDQGILFLMEPIPSFSQYIWLCLTLDINDKLKLCYSVCWFSFKLPETFHWHVGYMTVILYDYIFWRCLANLSSLSPWMLHITIYLWLELTVDSCCYVFFINQQFSEFAHLFFILTNH